MAPQNGKKILIVEDEAPLRNALADVLAFEGFTVFQGHDGKEGLELAVREHPDLILLDIIMPIMGGLDMLARLREDAWGKNASVILLTNLNDPDKVARAAEAGAYDFLVKSDWNIADVVKRIKARVGVR